MGAVMIKCPDTGRDIPTGFVADRRSFSSMPVFFGARILSDLPDRARVVRAAKPGCAKRRARRNDDVAFLAGAPLQKSAALLIAPSSRR